MEEGKKQNKVRDVFSELFGRTLSEHAVLSTLKNQQGKALQG